MPEELVMHLQSEYTHAWAVLDLLSTFQAGLCHTHPLPMGKAQQDVVAPTQAQQLYHLCGLACF